MLTGSRLVGCSEGAYGGRLLTGCGGCVGGGGCEGVTVLRGGGSGVILHHRL